MSETKLWSRMTSWMKPSARSKPANDRGDGAPDDESVSLSLTSRRPDPTLARLEEGYAKVIDLVDAIKRHQQEQELRAAEVSSSLVNIATTLECIDQAGQRQADSLELIAEQVRTGNQRSANWEEALNEFPKMAEAQREALASVVRQLEEAGRRDGTLSNSLDSFRDAVNTLGDATTASSVAIKDLQLSSLEQQERTAALIKEQGKRFTMLFVVTLVLAALGICAGIISLLK
ncbi:MAG: hypothetical protein H6817_05010 [Phycisphaerales bacterium]|nr:hypothetical protein [Phycisphaerales bacterium]